MSQQSLAAVKLGRSKSAGRWHQDASQTCMRKAATTGQGIGERQVESEGQESPSAFPLRVHRTHRGVLPSLFCWLKLAPRFSRNLTAPSCPFMAAQWLEGGAMQTMHPLCEQVMWHGCMLSAAAATIHLQRLSGTRGEICSPPLAADKMPVPN